MTKRRRSRAGEHYQAHLPLTLPKSLDLEVRAKQAIAIQDLIGELVAGLLVNGEPLTIAVSAKRVFDPDPDHERVLVSIHWRRAEMKGVELYQNVAFLRRCIKCAAYIRGEHTCQELPPAPSLSQSEKGLPFNEVSQ